MDDGGWAASADAFIQLIDQGAPERRLLLDPVMLRLCGDVAGRRVLDDGCGEGRFSRMLASAGADVVALDRTTTMVRAARARRCGPEHVVRGTGDCLPLNDASFDLVVSYIVLVDIPDFRAAIREMARVLRPGGRAVVANLSFMSVNTGWVRDEAGRRLHYSMDNYLEERPIQLEWAGVRITNWHRPLSAYMAAFLGAGLRLVEFLEPMPHDDSLRDDPRFEDWYRLPNFVVMAWEKE
ncbi:MAG TPA: class I SAM-dependent methyltransferase [Tepidiformaceae bacterium]|nr:class I SAM-dependent methyltransferase [Tepidiformaceae bacterium]